MDFLVCKYDPLCLRINIALEDIKDKKEAVSNAQEIALHTKVGATVGLFTLDADAICGWKVMKGDKLRSEPIDVIENTCCLGPRSFDFAKKKAKELQKSREDK